MLNIQFLFNETVHISVVSERVTALYWNKPEKSLTHAGEKLDLDCDMECIFTPSHAERRA